MIYTSYFARIKELERNGIIPISICAKAPNWYTGLQYKKLAPKYDFFMEYKRTHDSEHYIKCFDKQVLSNLDPIRVYQELCSLANSDNFALICYEKPSDFCHRHLVANWLNKNNYEFYIKEWGTNDTNKQ